MHILRLYIADHSKKCTEGIERLKWELNQRFGEQYSLEITNVLEQPEQAAKDKIIATPTLIRLSPGPERRMIGNLNNSEEVLLVIGLDAT